MDKLIGPISTRDVRSTLQQEQDNNTKVIELNRQSAVSPTPDHSTSIESSALNQAGADRSHSYLQINTLTNQIHSAINNLRQQQMQQEAHRSSEASNPHLLNELEHELTKLSAANRLLYTSHTEISPADSEDFTTSVAAKIAAGPEQAVHANQLSPERVEKLVAS